MFPIDYVGDYTTEKLLTFLDDNRVPVSGESDMVLEDIQLAGGSEAGGGEL